MKNPRMEFKVEEKVRARLKAHAALRGVSLGRLTNQALSEWLSSQPPISDLEEKVEIYG